MIKNAAHLKAPQEAVRNLQQVLLAARKVHRAAECSAMSEPILLEIQQREQEILEYLSRPEVEASPTCGSISKLLIAAATNSREKASRVCCSACVLAVQVYIPSPTIPRDTTTRATSNRRNRPATLACSSARRCCSSARARASSSSRWRAASLFSASARSWV
jgi:hypothetical protein